MLGSGNVVPESILFCTKSPNLPRVLAFLSKIGYNKSVFFLFGKRIGGNVMLSDIEIAQQAEMQKIREVAAGLSIEEDDLEYYGHYKAKLSESLFQKLEDKPNGKLILVTAINPTPAGEGKTTVSVGLADALRCIGKKSVVALREPSLGPVFRLFRWRTSTCTLQAICTPSPQPITCSVRCWTTICSRAMFCGSTSGE